MRGSHWDGEEKPDGWLMEEGGWGEEGVRRRGGPALNVVMWKGSNCRVCRSLNVAMEGAPDVVRDGEGTGGGEWRGMFVLRFASLSDVLLLVRSRRCLRDASRLRCKS